MIEYHKGDLFFPTPEQEWDVLFHGCNTSKVMGAGLALGVRRHFPEAYMAYMHSNAQPGTVSYTLNPQSGYVFNLITQPLNQTNRSLNYEWLYQSLCEMNEVMRRHFLRPKEAILASGRIGCGLAGGSWPIVEVMINDVFPDNLIKIFDWKKQNV